MLRIIAGEFRSRRIETPPDANSARPIPDRVRVALFNMLEGHFADGPFVDVFAGTGAFGLEAISRGTTHCTFIERDRDVASLLERNIAALGVEDRATLIRADALGPAAIAAPPRPVHVAFFDPPYPLMTDPASRTRVFRQLRDFIEILDPTGFAIIRSPWPFVDVTPDPDHPDRNLRTPVDLRLEGVRGPETHAYGSTALHWYMRATQETHDE